MGIYLIRFSLSKACLLYTSYRPQIVNHHAAQKSVPYSIDDPIMDESINIKGLLNLIVLSGKYKIESFTFASSGGALSGDIDEGEQSVENDTPQLMSPYAISKYTGEKYIKLYSELYGFKYTILRYANVYGPRQIVDGESGVIPIFMNNILEGKPSTLMAYEDMPKGCIRDYIYVSDVVEANMLSLIHIYIEKYIERNSENDIDYVWKENDYGEIKTTIDSLELVERALAIKKTSYAHTQKNEYRVMYEKEINELEKKKTEISAKLQESLMKISWLQDVMDTPIIDMKLYDNGSFDVIEYMKLKSELYDVISTW